VLIGVGDVDGEVSEKVDGGSESVGETSNELVLIGGREGIGGMDVESGVGPTHHIRGDVIGEDAYFVQAMDERESKDLLTTGPVISSLV
jgi:hypothetical protein